MAISEHARNRLYQKLQTLLGPEDATTLMELPGNDLVTRVDLDHLAAVTKAHIEQATATTRHQIEQATAATRNQIEQVEAATRNQIEQTRNRIEQVEAATRNQIEHVRAEIIQVDAKIDGVEERMCQRLEATEHKVLAAFRGELNAAITAQTRSMIFAMAGLLFTATTTALAAARFS